MGSSIVVVLCVCVCVEAKTVTRAVSSVDVCGGLPADAIREAAIDEAQ